MAQVIANNLQKMQSDIDSFSQETNRLKKEFAGMTSEITALTGMWKGPAHEEFVRQFAVDQENMQHLFEVLEDFEKMLREAKKKYAACEQEVAEEISGL